MHDAARLPTFIIGGAPRSGTTYLCHALERHPDVYMARPFIPEPKVLIMPGRSDEDCRRAYAEFFAETGWATARGEKTSYYFESAEACDRMRSVVPEVKLLFIVREPVGRAYSNYLWTRKNGLETLSFEEAIACEGERPNPLPPDKAYARPFDYLTRGHYEGFARRYIEAFGRDAVRFFIYEDLISRPADLLDEIQRFIGVEPIPFEACDPGVINAARQIGPPIDPITQATLRERMAPDVRAFAELTGLDVGLWGYDQTEPATAREERTCSVA